MTAAALTSRADQLRLILLKRLLYPSHDSTRIGRVLNYVSFSPPRYSTCPS